MYKVYSPCPPRPPWWRGSAWWRGSGWWHLLAVGIVLLSTFIAFLPVLRNDFVNWDDPDVIVNNQELGGPQVVRWAFTTTLIGHYQPLAWLVWSAIRSRFGLSAPAFHAVSLAAHLLNALLVYIVTWRLT